MSEDGKSFRNEDLVLQVRPHDPARFDETKYEPFLDELCGHREYQKTAIRTTLSFLLGGRYENLAQLAQENYDGNDNIRRRWLSYTTFSSQLQFPGKLAASLDLATGTGKSFVLYGVAMILLAEGAVEKVLVLCPSLTIEDGLLSKFRELAYSPALRDSLPPSAVHRTPSVVTANETIVDGSICVENYHAVLEHVKSSVRDSVRGSGGRVAVLNDEAHHVANEPGTTVSRWKEFLQSEENGFRYIVGVSGTCYVGNEYFSDVIARYSLREAIEQRFVKRVEYVAERPEATAREDRWQLIWRKHEDWRRRLASRGIRPITIVVTQGVAACKQIAAELTEWLAEWEKISPEAAARKVLVVTSNKEHQTNVRLLRQVDDAASGVEWVLSVSMLSEGWDVKNVFQIVPFEERAFNSKLLISQVLGRGLRRPDNWSGEDPMVTVFNHSAWSGRIRHLVNEVLEIERRVSCSAVPQSPFHLTLHQLDYERVAQVESYEMKGEYRLLEAGYAVLPSQVESQEVGIDFERAVTGERTRFSTEIRKKTYSAEDVAEQMYMRLKAIDDESATEGANEGTGYTKRFSRERIKGIVDKSLEEAGIVNGRVTEENRQRLLQALGPLRRKAAKRVVYTLKPTMLRTITTSERPRESCSASELGRGSKSIFYTDNSSAHVIDEQLPFFEQIIDPYGDMTGSRFLVQNPADYKAPLSFTIADAGVERRFIGMLTERANANSVDAWVKNSAMGFYAIEYAWKKGEHPKRGEFSPDFFLKKDEMIYSVEIKDDSEVSDPSPENIKKHEFATAHFARLNEHLEEASIGTRYQFNMVAQRDLGAFFQKLRDGSLTGYRSELDVAMLTAA